MSEPQHVRDARQVIRGWELHNGHHIYVDCLDGGFRGYQAACWDCDWRGAEYLRGYEKMGTEESRAHKRNAQTEAAEHQRNTVCDKGQEPPC